MKKEEINNLIIRTATEEDLPRCEELFKSKEFVCADNEYWTQEWLKEYIITGLFLVAVLDNKVVGSIFGEKLINGGSMIWLLSVEEIYRSQGIGSKLVNEFENIAKSMGCEWVLVYSDLHNPKTLAFYQKINYSIGSNLIECIKVF